jgi:hypothetical protein
MNKKINITPVISTTIIINIIVVGGLYPNTYLIMEQRWKGILSVYVELSKGGGGGGRGGGGGGRKKIGN